MATLENREDMLTDVMGPRFPPNKPCISLIAGSKLNDLNAAAPYVVACN